MIGGIVIETQVLEAENRVWINIRGTGCESGDTLGVYVEADDKARSVSEGDVVWWQATKVYWTPRVMFGDRCRVQGETHDIELKKIGYSNQVRPENREAVVSDT